MVDSTSVTVIGAGVAGLSAADQLAKRGYKVTVLEANDRIGGRVHTITTQSGDVVEAGANWIHHPDLFKLIKNPLSSTPDEDEDKVDKAKVYNLGTYEFALNELLYKARPSGFLNQALDSSYAFSNAVKPQNLGEWRNYFVTSGLMPVLQATFDVDRLDIRLNARVSSVVQDDVGVSVTYLDNANNTHVIQSDYVINTMPATVLASSQNMFTPVLAPALVNALSAIKMTSIRKVSLTFSTQAFASAVAADGDGALVHSSYLLFADKDADRVISFINLNAMNSDASKQNSTTLLAFIDYNHRDFINLSTEQITGLLLNMVTQKFPELNQDSLAEVHDVDWSKNEFSLGAWPYVAERTTVQAMEPIQQAHGRMILAGDWTVVGTSDMKSFYLGDDMYAAAMSGHAAAEKIAELVGQVDGEQQLPRDDL